MIRDLIPNPYVGREIVGRLHARLRERGFGDQLLGRLAGLIISELRMGLDKERDKRAEDIFRARVTKGEIQFRLRTDGQNWRMPFETETVEQQDAPRLDQPEWFTGPEEPFCRRLSQRVQLRRARCCLFTWMVRRH